MITPRSGLSCSRPQAWLFNATGIGVHRSPANSLVSNWHPRGGAQSVASRESEQRSKSATTPSACQTCIEILPSLRRAAGCNSLQRGWRQGDRGTPGEHALREPPQNPHNSARRFARKIPVKRAILASPSLHGKEGVAGSSPAEGFRNRATARFSYFGAAPLTPSEPFRARRGQGFPWRSGVTSLDPTPSRLTRRHGPSEPLPGTIRSR